MNQKFKKLVVVSNTFDATTDILVNIARDRGVEVFRINTDSMLGTEIYMDKNRFFFKIGQYQLDAINDQYILLYRKPFNGPILSDHQQTESLSEYSNRNLKEILNYFYEVAGSRLRLVDPTSALSAGKIKQKKIASKFFLTPDYFIGKINALHGSKNFFDKECVVKSLGSPVYGKKILFTKEVDLEFLDKNEIWFLEKKVIGNFDVTCVYINGSCDYYKYDVPRSDRNIDFRKDHSERGIEKSKWSNVNRIFEKKYDIIIGKFMKKMNLKFGRIDFIELDNELIFLEVNPNGQFAWLDLNSEFPIHNKLFNELFSDSSIIIS